MTVTSPDPSFEFVAGNRGEPLRVWADTATLDQIATLARHERVSGFTTNPTLFREAGAEDYRDHAHRILDLTSYPVNFEILSDDPSEMVDQAHSIASWRDDVIVKVPCVHADGRPTTSVLWELADLNVNVTAIFNAEQACAAMAGLRSEAILSIFAGRIHDNLHDAGQVFRECRAKPFPLGNYNHRLLWASARQVYDYRNALYCSADIITLSPALIAKLESDFTAQGTVRQFLAAGLGYSL